MSIPVVLEVFAAVLGAIVGSFLNACIYRMPRDISIGDPKRSFCPTCKKTIPWFMNLPVISWIALRGKCAFCATPISPRYLGVELLTAGLFLWIWLQFGLPAAPAYWVFVSLLVAATFIDFDFTIIPDEITIGGTVAGVIACAIVPGLMGVDSRWFAIGWSVAGAALGFFLLWGVVELGKVAFGRKRIRLDPVEPFSLREEGDSAVLEIGGEKWPWEEIFSRESDALILRGQTIRLNGVALDSAEVKVYYNRVVAGARVVPIEAVHQLTGTLKEVVIPREAMGFGDVKFIACIGAFLGWQAVLFTLFASSIIGAFVGSAMLLISRGKSGGRIPFGPYLALGALAWLAIGPASIAWYFGLLRP